MVHRMIHVLYSIREQRKKKCDLCKIRKENVKFQTPLNCLSFYNKSIDDMEIRTKTLKSLFTIFIDNNLHLK